MDDSRWIAPLFWLNYPDQDIFRGTNNFDSKYWISLYYSILYLGSNEIGPVSVFNLIVAIVILMICAFVNAFVLGDMAAVVATLSKGYKTEMDI